MIRYVILCECGLEGYRGNVFLCGGGGDCTRGVLPRMGFCTI